MADAQVALRLPSGLPPAYGDEGDDRSLRRLLETKARLARLAAAETNGEASALSAQSRQV